jgi:hypothetical protein
MPTDTSVGFWGNTGAGWGLAMDTTTGSVGLGVPPPVFADGIAGLQLDVNNRVRVRQGASSGAGIWFYQTNPQADQAFIGMPTDTSVGLWGNTGAGWGLIMNTTSGNVGIGQFDSGVPLSRLHVDGDVRVSNGSFIDDGSQLDVPDYVFAEDYALMPLDDLAAYLAREKHLPNVPGQEEIDQDGLDLSQFQMRLLEKVEELTLYTLAQQEQIDAQQQEIITLQATMSGLEARLAALEQGK